MTICPDSLNECFYLLSAGREGKNSKAESSLLFVSVWLSSYPFWKSSAPCMLTVLLDILPTGINVLFFLTHKPINSWPKQEFLGARSPWKCVTLIPYIFPTKSLSPGVMDCAKICLDFSKKCDPRPRDGGELWLKRCGYLTPDRRLWSRENDSGSLSFQHRCCSGFI